MDDQNAEEWGSKDRKTTPATTSTTPSTPTTGPLYRGTDATRNTGRSGRQNAATQRNMRRDERVTVQGPVKNQPPDGMSHGGGVGYVVCDIAAPSPVTTHAFGAYGPGGGGRSISQNI